MNKYKNILLDMDGTMINSEAGVTKGIIYALASIGIPEPSVEQMRKCIGPPLTDSFLNVYGVPPEKLWDVMKVYRSQYDTTGMFDCELYDGIRECITALHDRGYFVGLASSKNESACRAIIEHFHLTDLFDDIVGSTQDATIETKQDVLKEAFRRNPQLNLENTVLVGDTHFDVEGAKAINLDCIGVTYGFGTKQELLDSGAVLTLDSAWEVRDFFE